MALFFGLVVGAVARSHRRKSVTGREGLIGQVGRVRSVLEPRGMVFVDGALWEARSETGPSLSGERVEVVGMDGLTLRVRPAVEAPALAGARAASTPRAGGPPAVD